jgi:sporulation protein YlmC with PRC-barrel domain
MVSARVNCYGMAMSRRPVTVKILFALPLVVTLAWAVLGAAQTNPFSMPIKAAQSFGMRVEDSDGQKVGTLRNLIVDTRSGELKYAVIGSGGIFGVHSTLRLAPTAIMSAGTAKRETLAVFVNNAQWKNAPIFKPASLASLADPKRAREISRYFEPSPPTAASAAKHSLSTTGHETGEQTNTPRAEFKFASDLTGLRVVNSKQEKIGEVIDLLVSFGRPRGALAIISTTRFMRRDHEFAVPLKALSPTDDSRKLLLDVDTATLQQAPVFNQQVWESPSTNGGARIYRYSKGDE